MVIIPVKIPKKIMAHNLRVQNQFFDASHDTESSRIKPIKAAQGTRIRLEYS
jgi:hypothetical protein